MSSKLKDAAAKAAAWFEKASRPGDAGDDFLNEGDDGGDAWEQARAIHAELINALMGDT